VPCLLILFTSIFHSSAALQKEIRLIYFIRIQAAIKANANGAPQFPIDFFEHCAAMTDIEFGGNDLLQVYNTAQIKHRLNTTGKEKKNQTMYNIDTSKEKHCNSYCNIFFNALNNYKIPIKEECL
jgi:hypothetical protein